MPNVWELQIGFKRKNGCQKGAWVFGQDSFDKILVDAPCSGIGLLRRKPDIKYNKETADFASLQEIQLEILGSVCQTLRKGGIITYSTCTIVSEENFQVVQAFLESHPEFEQVTLEHECKDIMKDGCILITPELYGSDGFLSVNFVRYRIRKELTHGNFIINRCWSETNK